MKCGRPARILVMFVVNLLCIASVITILILSCTQLGDHLYTSTSNILNGNGDLTTNPCDEEPFKSHTPSLFRYDNSSEELGCAWAVQFSALRLSMVLLGLLILGALFFLVFFDYRKLAYIFAFLLLACGGVVVYIIFRDSIAVGKSDAWCYKDNLEGVSWQGTPPVIHCQPYWSLVWVCLLDGACAVTFVLVAICDILWLRAPRRPVTREDPSVEASLLPEPKKMQKMKPVEKKTTTYQVSDSEVDFGKMNMNKPLGESDSAQEDEYQGGNVEFNFQSRARTSAQTGLPVASPPSSRKSSGWGFWRKKTSPTVQTEFTPPTSTTPVDPVTEPPAKTFTPPAPPPTSAVVSHEVDFSQVKSVDVKHGLL
ncbi:hypothetical protein Pelo_634 [Pelomyxa schiedti]|nr:hypothetical protein Pelo_634 [Pelomyxa schiedti]